MSRNTIGVDMTKKSSSRKRMVIVSVVALPILIPSLLRKNILNALPPTEDGVTAEVNSHSNVTLTALLHFRSPSVRIRKRQAIPPSRPTTAISARPMNSHTLGVKRISLIDSALNSELKSQITTPRPIMIGSAIFHQRPLLFGVSLIINQTARNFSTTSLISPDKAIGLLTPTPLTPVASNGLTSSGLIFPVATTGIFTPAS